MLVLTSFSMQVVGQWTLPCEVG